MRFRFTTSNLDQKKALLLFMSQSKNDLNVFNDFFSVSLDRGTLFLHVNLGHGKFDYKFRIV